MSCGCKEKKTNAPGGIVDNGGTGSVIYETWNNPKVMFGVAVLSLLLTLIALSRG